MTRIPWLSTSHHAALAAGPGAEDAHYEAALNALLAQAVRPPGTLERLRKTVWSSLKALHARRRDDGESLPPEYWFLHC